MNIQGRNHIGAFPIVRNEMFSDDWHVRSCILAYIIPKACANVLLLNLCSITKRRMEYMK